MEGRPRRGSHGRATARRGRLRGLRHGRAARLLMCDARDALAAAVAVVRTLARGVECLPRDAGRIVDPRLLRLGVAARRLTLLDDVSAGVVQPRVNLLQLVSALRLNTEMVEASLPTAGRDREVDARIAEHPFRVVGLDDGRLRCEQRRVEADGPLEIIHGDVHVKPLHWRLLWVCTTPWA